MPASSSLPAAQTASGPSVRDSVGSANLSSSFQLSMKYAGTVLPSLAPRLPHKSSCNLPCISTFKIVAGWVKPSSRWGHSNLTAEWLLPSSRIVRDVWALQNPAQHWSPNGEWRYLPTAPIAGRRSFSDVRCRFVHLFSNSYQASYQAAREAMETLGSENEGGSLGTGIGPS